MYRYLSILQYIMMCVFFIFVFTHIYVYRYTYQFINKIRVLIRFIVENKCFDLQLFDKKLDLIGIIWRPKLKMSGTGQNNRVEQETIVL